MRISVVLDALTGSFETDMKRASKTAQKEMAAMEKSIASTAKKVASFLVVGAGAVWLKNAIKDSIAFASTLDDMSKATGISAEKLQELEFAATKTGTDLESLRGGLAKFSKNIAEAASGSKQQVAAFAAIGVSIRDASGNIKSMDVLLKEVATKFAGYSDGALESALSMEFFGKAGANLLPFLNEGGEGIDALGERAKSLGLILDNETVEAMEAFGDELQVSSDLQRALKANLTRDLLPVLGKLNNAFISAASEGGALNKSFEGLGDSIIAETKGLSVGAEYLDRLLNSIAASAAIIHALSSGGGMKQADRISADFTKRMADNAAAYKLFRDELDKPYQPPVRMPRPGDEGFVGPLPGKNQAPTVGTGEADKAAKEAARARKAAFDLINAEMKNAVEFEKEIGKERLAVLDDQYAQGLVSLKDYYDQRFGIEKTNADKEVQLLQAEIEQTKKLRAAAVEPSEKAGFEVKLIELTGKLKQAQLEQSNAHKAGLREENAAMREQQQILAALAIDAQENRSGAGLADEASALEHQRSMRLLSDREYFAGLKDLEDAAYQSSVEIERARLATFQGTEDQKIAAAEASKVRREALELEHQNAIKEIDRAAIEETTKYQLEMQQAIEDNFANFFGDVLTGTKSVGDAFRDLAKGILNEIGRIAAKKLAAQLFGGEGDSGGNGLVGQAFSAISDYFKQGKAGGGAVSPYSMQRVNEEGPELLSVAGRDYLMMGKQGGTVTPNHRLGGGNVTNVYQTIMAPEGRISKLSARQARAAVVLEQREAGRNL